MTAAAIAPVGATFTRRGRMESVHATHARPLLRFLLGMTRNERPAAEDLLQETMLRVWRHIDDVPVQEENERKWLFTVARRVAIDAVRARKARPAEVSLLEADTMTTLDSTDGTMALEDLKEAFNRLTEGQQLILRELHLHGSSIEEASKRLEIPSGTVKSRAHYAMRALHAALNPADQ